MMNCVRCGKKVKWLETWYTQRIGIRKGNDGYARKSVLILKTMVWRRPPTPICDLTTVS